MEADSMRVTRESQSDRATRGDSLEIESVSSRADAQLPSSERRRGLNTKDTMTKMVGEKSLNVKQYGSVSRNIYKYFYIHRVQLYCGHSANSAALVLQFGDQHSLPGCSLVHSGAVCPQGDGLSQHQPGICRAAD